MPGLLYSWWLAALASVAVLFGRKRRALDVYQQIVALRPRDERARSTVGNLQMELGDPRAAVRTFEALTAMSPRYAAGWFNLGFIHDHCNEEAAAERCFKAAVELDPKLDRAWYGLGLVLIRQGRLVEAVAALKRNTRLQPYSPYGWYQLAMTHHHLGEGEEAWRIQAELSKFEPRFATTLKQDIERTPARHAGAAHSTFPADSSKEAIATTT
jgi:predicted Zn-dependent protease